MMMDKLEPSVMICSPPKAGRTLLRYLIALYLNRFYQLGMTEDLSLGYLLVPNYRYGFRPKQPDLRAVDPERDNNIEHDIEHDRDRKIPKSQIHEACCTLARYNAPILSVSHTAHPARKLTRQSKHVLLVRNVFDSLVSRYHQQRYRRPEGIQGSFQGERFDYIKNTSVLPELVAYLNAWSQQWQNHRGSKRLFITTYEQLRTQKYQIALQILTFAEIPVNQPILKSAVQDSSFEAMQAKAIEKVGDRYSGSPSQLRVRSGSIYAYKTVLSKPEIDYIQHYLDEHLVDAAKQLVRQYGLGQVSWLKSLSERFLTFTHFNTL